MRLGNVSLLLFLGMIWSSEAEYRRVCYFTNWAQYRTGAGKYTPENIPTDLCTHVIYAFAKLQGTSLTTLEDNDNELYQQVTGLKSSNPAMKTMIAVGGWTAGSAPFSSMARTASNRASFIQSAIKFLRAHNFDGLDIDWEYPAARGGVPADKANLALLLKEMRAAFEREAASSGKDRLLLSVAVPAGKSHIDEGYDVRAMGQSVDFINLMTYDLHGSWDGKTGENAPLYSRKSDYGADKTLTVSYAAMYWVTRGAPRTKINVGMPLYGRSYMISGGPNTGVGAPSSGEGQSGMYTGEAGFLAYNEICKMMESGGTDHWESEQHVPYYVNGQLWVGYDNVRSITEKDNPRIYDNISSITEKSQWVKTMGFGGAMVWALDTDDFNRQCSSSTQTYPLLRAIKAVLGGSDAHVVYTTLATKPTSTTMNPWATTENPMATTKNPWATTVDPWAATTTTTKAPLRTTQSPWATTKSPLATTLDPWAATTTKMPLTTTQNSWTTTIDPWATTTKPWATHSKTTSPPVQQSTQKPSTVVTHNHQSSAGFTCGSRADGYYKMPGSCTVFYRCVSGHAERFSCTTGTQYNPKLHMCDWPYNVNCTPGK